MKETPPGQISILENGVSGNPAAIVIAPTQFKAPGQPINEAATKVKTQYSFS
jgi:ribose transport system substrate-binding protein